MKWLCLMLGSLAGLAGLPFSVAAQTAYPMLMSIKPVAVQVGQTSQHVINSRYDMFGAYQVLVSGEGVTAEAILPEVKAGAKPPSVTKLTVKFHVDAQALTGVRDVRVATPRGVSTVGQLVIVGSPVIREQAKNNTLDTAQPVEMPATLCGAIESAEDVDQFKFAAQAGQSLCFHVRCMRLQDRIHDLQRHADPILTLRNGSGSIVATCDNYFFGDPLLSHQFTETGDYTLEIRDVRYSGNPYWEYSIEVSAQPFVTNVHPTAVRQGQQQPLQLIGLQLPPQRDVTLSVAADAGRGAQRLRIPLGEHVSNPVPVIVSDLPLILENDAENNDASHAQPVTLPAGICGRIDQPSDLDCFSFEVKKGDRVSVEVAARRHASQLDSVVRILDAQGKPLIENDDLKLYKHSFADSQIDTWTAPADGKFTLEVRDLHLRGGDRFVYFIRLTPAEPYFTLYLDTDKTQLTPGTSGVLFANVERKNGFAGSVRLEIDGLPDGVQASCATIAPEARDGAIILTADSKSPLSVATIRVRGVSQSSGAEGRELSVPAVTYQETYQPGGGRGHWPVEGHVVCVAAAADIRAVRLNTEQVTLKPGQSQRIEIEIERAAGFEKNVQLDLLFRHLSSVYADTLPKGVTIDTKNSKTLLTGKTSQGHVTLIAAADAKPSTKRQVSVMANVSLNFVMKATYSSRPLWVRVVP